MAIWLGISILFVLAIFAALYNRLVRSRNRVDTAWSDIDVQLQRRHDLIPRLVSTVEAYSKYERATFEAVTQLRNEAIKITAVEQRGELEEKLSSGVQRLLALAENYPELKASKNFLQLQHQLVETENHLQFARRYYNGSVRDYNTIIETVPSNLVAVWFRFTGRNFFQNASDQDSDVPVVDIGSVE